MPRTHRGPHYTVNKKPVKHIEISTVSPSVGGILFNGFLTWEMNTFETLAAYVLN